jgi:hypothetical protein
VQEGRKRFADKPVGRGVGKADRVVALAEGHIRRFRRDHISVDRRMRARRHMNIHGVTFAVSRIADTRWQEMGINALGWQDRRAADEKKRCDESSL